MCPRITLRSVTVLKGIIAAYQLYIPANSIALLTLYQIYIELF